MQSSSPELQPLPAVPPGSRCFPRGLPRPRLALNQVPAVLTSEFMKTNERHTELSPSSGKCILASASQSVSGELADRETMERRASGLPASGVGSV